MREYEKQHGHRLLDYFDEHYYPLNQDGENDDIRLQASRSLWDPSYIEKNWVGKWRGAIDLIPTFHKWVDTQYPGTKISISEYGWGNPRSFIAALGEIDVLGIFGRERLDLACMFGPPKATDDCANAFRMYRDYDGQGGQFGDIGVAANSGDQARLAIYAAQRTGDHAVTVIVINKTTSELTSQITLAQAGSSRSAKVFRYSNDNPKAIVAAPDQTMDTHGFTATFPGRSATLFVIAEKH
jgi:hypothetical protein